MASRNPNSATQQASVLKTQVETTADSGSEVVSPTGQVEIPSNLIRPKETRPLALTLVSVLLLLVGVYRSGTWLTTHAIVPKKFDPTLFCLPVGIGLLRLRFWWRRYALGCVWLGYATLLLILGLVFAKANGVTWLPSSMSIESFGWKPNAVQATWVDHHLFGVCCGAGVVPCGAHAAQGQSSLRITTTWQATWLAGEVGGIWLLLFAFAWSPSQARTSPAPAVLRVVGLRPRSSAAPPSP